MYIYTVTTPTFTLFTHIQHKPFVFNTLSQFFKCSSSVLHLLHGFPTTASVQLFSADGINWTTFNCFPVNHHCNCCFINSYLQATSHFGSSNPHLSCNSLRETRSALWILGRLWKYEEKWYWPNGGIEKARLGKLLSASLWPNLHFYGQGVLEIRRFRLPLHRLTCSGGKDGYCWEIHSQTSEYGGKEESTISTLGQNICPMRLSQQYSSRAQRENPPRTKNFTRIWGSGWRLFWGLFTISQHLIHKITSILTRNASTIVSIMELSWIYQLTCSSIWGTLSGTPKKTWSPKPTFP